MASERLRRDVIEALRRILAQHRPEGCAEAALCRGMERAGVPREVYDEAVGAMLLAGWARRRQGRLCATAAIAPAPRPKLRNPTDTVDETAEHVSETITIIGATRPRDGIR